MGSPLAVFLALRGIRPGNRGTQEHILPRAFCNRLFNVFHPADPVVSLYSLGHLSWWYNRVAGTSVTSGPPVLRTEADT